MVAQPEAVIGEAGQHLDAEHPDVRADEQVIDLPADPTRVVGRGACKPLG